MKFALTKSALAAVAIEALMVLGLIVFSAKQPAKAQPAEPMVMLTFPTPVEQPKTPPPEKEKPVELPKPVPQKTAQPKPSEVKEPDPPKITEPSPIAEATPVSLPSKPVETPKAAPTVSDNFKGGIRAAVQAAMVYPASAKMAHVTGKTEVIFNYQDGRVSNISVLVSSGFNTLDAAARRAVEAATYPVPPPEFVGKLLQFEVWVRFFSKGLDDD
ncbi:MAG: TonB family protein [Gallionella sp.]